MNYVLINQILFGIGFILLVFVMVFLMTDYEIKDKILSKILNQSVYYLIPIGLSLIIFSGSYLKHLESLNKLYTLEIKQNPVIKVESISKINVESENGVFTATYEEKKGEYKTITFSSEFTIVETEKEGE